MLAGSGAIFTSIPSEVLEKLGMPEERTETVRLADLRPKRRTRGRTIMRLQGEELSTPVTFGEPGEPGLLGDLTLGDAVLAVDPHTRKLIPVEGLLMTEGCGWSRLKATGDAVPSVSAESNRPGQCPGQLLVMAPITPTGDSTK